MFLCPCGVGTTVCGQRADALPSLIARLHALVYLWCWDGRKYGVYTRSCSVARKAHALAHVTLHHRSSGARMLLVHLLVVLVQQYGICTRSCSVDLKACSGAFTCRACRYSSMLVTEYIYGSVHPLSWKRLRAYMKAMKTSVEVEVSSFHLRPLKQQVRHN